MTRGCEERRNPATPDALHACYVGIMATQKRKIDAETSRRNASGLARDIRILEVLAEAEAPEGLGVVRVAAALGRDKATVSRALSTLAEAGLLSRDEDSRLYRVGPKIFALAALTTEATLVREARPFLRRLARQSRETAHLSVLRGGGILTLLSELSPNEVRTASWEGRSSDPLRTPSGRVLVSEWSDAELADWYAQHASAALHLSAQLATNGLHPAEASAPTPPWLDVVEAKHAVHDLPSLLVEVARIRKAGYSTSDEEFEIGVVAASAPVRDHTDRIVAALNISAPKARVGANLDRLGVYVARAANRLSQQLGGPARPEDTTAQQRPASPPT